MNLSTVHIHTVVRIAVSIGIALQVMLLPVLSNASNTPSYEYSDETIETDLMNSESIVTPKYNSTVRGHIVTYLKLNRDKTQRLLDRSMVYFPLIEQYLEEYDLPDELKYLAIVESSLIPTARSRAGAVGLWQFMSFTGREHDLRIYKSVDERMDPHKSTEAAMQYLTRLYNEFGDWALAMAAYNSGPGRVRTAIRRSGSRDFWVLQRYLPRETRGYIPKFVAAAYVFKKFNEHGFVPALPELDMLFTAPITIYDQMSFDQISEITGVEKQVIKDLNPSYRYNYVPGSTRGYTLVLPTRAMELMTRHLEGDLESDLELQESFELNEDILAMNSQDVQYIISTYVLDMEETLFDVAAKFNMDPYQLKYWNQLHARSNTAALVSLQIPLTTRQQDILERILFEQRMLDAIDVQLDMPKISLLELSMVSLTSLVQPDDQIDANDGNNVRLLRGESLDAVMRRQRRRPNTEAINTKDRYVRYGQKIAVTE